MLAYLIVCTLSLRHFHALPLTDDNMRQAMRKAVVRLNGLTKIFRTFHVKITGIAL